MSSHRAVGRRPRPVVQLLQLRAAPDRRGRWNGGRSPATASRTTPPPDNPPPPPLAGLPGNHVTLRIAPGIYVLYAHMKPGSVRVRVGERVRRGQVLGELGNSGNSATPHLHSKSRSAQLRSATACRSSSTASSSWARSPTRSGTGTLGLRPNGQLTFAPAPGSGTRRREMPLNHNVVRFPTPKSGSGGKPLIHGPAGDTPLDRALNTVSPLPKA